MITTLAILAAIYALAFLAVLPLAFVICRRLAELDRLEAPLTPRARARLTPHGRGDDARPSTPPTLAPRRWRHLVPLPSPRSRHEN